ncbi:STAS domain-containing protein [Candidatus Profftia tarda]|nr:STAS domain-containing protein [Candidatus Profftia tarda]
MSFWKERDILLEGKKCFDLSRLERLDSAGLAMLVYLQHSSYPRIAVAGVNQHVKMLIELYNLHDILITESTSVMS